MTVAALIAAVLLAGGVGTVWAAQGSGTVDPPPSVAFVASAFNYPDALAVGPVAGRLGAPLLLTAPDALSDETADGLGAADPDLVIIAGGTAAVSQTVEDQIAALLPDAAIERAAGATRTETAELLAELTARFNPAWLPVAATAADADLLDGLDSTEFLSADSKAADADLLDGNDSTDFLGVDDVAADADRLAGAPAWNYVHGRLVERHNPVEVPWGEPIRVLAMETPASHYYEVAWELSFSSRSEPEDFADGRLVCYVSTGGDLHISGSGIQADAAKAVSAGEIRLVGGFPVMRASPGLLRPVRHDRGWFSIECVNTLEDDAGNPLDVFMSAGVFSTNKLERQPWIDPRPAE